MGSTKCQGMSGNIRLNATQKFPLPPGERQTQGAHHAAAISAPSAVIAEMPHTGVRVMPPPGERQTGGTADSGNATKCHTMPQKHNFHLSPSAISAPSAVNSLTPSPVAGEGWGEGDAPPGEGHKEEARPIVEMSQNVSQCHKIAKPTQLPSAISAPSAVNPLTPSPVAGEGWGEGDAPTDGEPQRARTAHSGNVTKCLPMSQK